MRTEIARGRQGEVKGRGEIPEDLDRAINFLLVGLTLFAPYLVNKFSSLFESLAPKAKG